MSWLHEIIFVIVNFSFFHTAQYSVEITENFFQKILWK